MPRKSSKKIENFNEIISKFLNDGVKLFQLSKEYKIPYSTLRRLVIQYITEEQIINTQEKFELPYEGFECLDIGTTFSWKPGGDIYLVKSIEKVSDGMGGTDYVWITYKTSKKADRHFYPEDLDQCYNKIDAKTRYKSLKKSKN